MADPDEALIEAIAEALRTHNIECTGLGEVTCRGCRELGWMSWPAYREHVARAMVAHLGLVEERCCDDAYRDREEFGKYSVYTCADMERSCITRLAQPWPDRVEVDHGSE